MDHASEPLVTIAHYSQLHESKLAKVLLESAGIPVFLADEHINALRGSLNAIQVRVQVPESTATAARALLAEHESPATACSETNACPNCGSTRTRNCRGQLAALLASLFFGLPLMKARRLQCLECNHRWNSRWSL